MISATLVTGPSPDRREAAIAAAIAALAAEAGYQAASAAIAAHDVPESQPDAQAIAVLLEGFPSGKAMSPLAVLAHPQPPQTSAMPPLRVARIAKGCLCCAGGLAMRVTLNRMLRERPAARHLFIGTDDDTHLQNLRDTLQAPPYRDWLTLTADLVAN